MLPDLPAVLRPDLHRGRRQGPRAAVRQGLQRLDGRRVVRRVGRPAHPADASSRCGTPSSPPTRCAATPARGVHAVCFSEIPPYLGLPSMHDPDYWDPFFAACAETDTVSTCTSARRRRCRRPRPTPRRRSGRRSPSPTPCSRWSTSCSRACSCASPTSTLAYSEGQIGWIPYILERADKVWEENRGWDGVADKVPEPPSTYFHRQIYGCFFDDVHGLQLASRRSASTTSPTRPTTPTPTRTWPHTREVAEKQMATSTTTRAARSCAATPSGSSGSTHLAP